MTLAKLQKIILRSLAVNLGVLKEVEKQLKKERYIIGEKLFGYNLRLDKKGRLVKTDKE